MKEVDFTYRNKLTNDGKMEQLSDFDDIEEDGVAAAGLFDAVLLVAEEIAAADHVDEILPENLRGVEIAHIGTLQYARFLPDHLLVPRCFFRYYSSRFSAACQSFCVQKSNLDKL